MNIDEFNNLIQQEPQIAQSLENAAWHVQAKKSTCSLDPITVTALVLFFPIITEIVVASDCHGSLHWATIPNSGARKPKPGSKVK